MSHGAAPIFAALFAALLTPLPAQATAPDDPFHLVARLDERVQTAGWRLARGNRAFCPDLAPATGLLLQDLQGWDEPVAARGAFGVSPSTQVIVGAVAAGSPAQKAGLRAGEPVRTIADTVTEGDLPAAAPGSFARQTALFDLLDASLARNGSVAIGTDGEDGKRRFLKIAGEPACASRFEIQTSGDLAKADGRRVLVSATMALELADEDQFAFVVAHEMAHNLLGHVALLRQTGRGWSKVRRTEREADRLAVWLMANAGYDPAGAAAFMKGWARANDAGFLDPTHDAWDERLAGVEAEIALLAAEPRRVGGYDWSRRFPRGGTVAKSDR